MMRIGCWFSVACIVALTATSIAVAMRNSQPPSYANPRRGAKLVESYGCLACHDTGRVGPHFAHMGRRGYIAGRYPNIQIWMIDWIEHPQQLKPGTAMPNLGVTERDARDITAYLATLR
jgi:cytochrome c2